MTYLVVSSLADLHATVAAHGATDVLTLINADTVVERPATIAAVLMRDYIRGRDDAMVLVVRRVAEKA